MSSSPRGAGYERACLVLVDYDNAFPPNREPSDEEVAHEVARWLQQLSDRDPRLERFTLRLYGGWYDEIGLSKRGSDVARVMALMPKFPMRVERGRIVRGDISLAVSPIASVNASPLLGTYRRRGSLPRIRLARHPYPDDCAQIDATCPAAILKSFTRGARKECPVDTCSLIASDAFVVHEQKMVDTLMATDILTAGQLPSDYSAIVVVSGDSDFVPPLLAAKLVSEVSLVQLVPRAEDASAYATSVLTDVGVEILEVAR